MKFKVGDYAKPKDGHAKECGSYGNDGSYIKITGIEADYLYNIYDDYGRYTTRCSICFDDDNLQPYTPTPAQLKNMGVEEEVEANKAKRLAILQQQIDDLTKEANKRKDK